MSIFQGSTVQGKNAKKREDMKRKYCGGGSSQCARYIIAKALGLNEVHWNLFPNDLIKANILLEIP
jgi:hypothetical protein